MLRSIATRSPLKGFPRVLVARPIYNTAPPPFRNAAALHQLSNKRPQILRSISRPTTTSLLYATKTTGPLDPKEIEETLESKIKPAPEDVSTDSSVRHVFEESPAAKRHEDEMMSGIKSDVETIKETFALTEVPRDALYLGAAGVIPYAATSISTVALAWDINHATNGQGFLFSPETAHQLLDIVTPIQVGYGAVIISFLGAIHWGLEYAEYGGRHSYRRYWYGVVAPAVAWPTIFMPVEYALITQFLAFNFLYFADARATVRGWFPSWYSTYRFVLTFLVGASIVLSLVGRGQIVRHDHHAVKSPLDQIHQDRDSQWAALAFERSEKEKHAKEEEEAEEGEEEEEGGDEESGDGEEEKSKDKKEKK